MLSQVENQFAARPARAVDHKAVYGKTLRMMNSSTQRHLRPEPEPAASAMPTARARSARAACWPGGWWRRGSLRRGFARRVGHPRQQLRDALEPPLPELDQGMAAWWPTWPSAACSITRWSSGWANSAARPRINQNAGRDHWPRSWSVVMGGGGMKGGRTVGATDKDGIDIVDRPVGVMDLVATMTKPMGINIDTQYTTPRGRPMKVVDGGKPIGELVG